MMEAAQKPKKKWLLFLSLTTLILVCNFFVYRLEEVPEGMVIGSIVDMMLVIPLLAYFFIIRRRHSFKTLSLVIAAGYGAAWIIIPNDHLSSLPFFKYLLFAAEGALLLFELFIAFHIIKTLPKVWKYTKELEAVNGDFFPHRLETAIQENMSAPLFIKIYLTELSLFYYSLFSWKKKPLVTEDSFTLHQKTSTIPLYIMIIHAILLETIGLHYLLHQWTPIVSWILLALNMYTVFFILAQIQGFRLNPVRITDDQLIIRLGFASRINIPLQKIESIKEYEPPEKIGKETEKVTFKAIAPDFIEEKPQIEILLKESQKVFFLYGYTKSVSQIHIRLDDPSAFKLALTKKITF
ncbi:hypothetical protein FZC84_02460 [Rossellomorea vietnamensis]|uniref:Beta-carotene 15,15'-monooxygenase n=1 Tax=Rossellomorea vietnamensis TaxID=218284 RepID=A0A5D4MJS7_9BACI|nr:hypothetical protein [Rossellomorea vietnamensis]TYS01534.1 hypothetical protein FZC84_02460 [Rossellomorea vietnamensis]